MVSFSKLVTLYAGLVANFNLIGSALGDAPKAPHLAYNVAKDNIVEIALVGYDKDGDKLKATITELPSEGKVYQLAPQYSKHGTGVKFRAEEDEIVLANTVLTDSKRRFIYVPTANVAEPVGRWSSLKYLVSDSTKSSAEGVVELLAKGSPNVIVSSKFDTSSEGWTLIGNGASGNVVQHRSASHGILINNFIYGTDDSLNTDPKTGNDKDLWKFSAPSLFLGKHPHAYGGYFKFNIVAFTGDHTNPNNLNSDRPFVELRCETCDTGRGMRFVYRENSFNGSPSEFSLHLNENAGWLKDPKNSNLQWTKPTSCEMVEMLSSLSGITILGDHTKWYESIGIDNVQLTAGSRNPVPVSCICTNPGYQCPLSNMT